MKPLIYLDNIIFSLQKVGGISIYWKELLQRLACQGSRVLMFEHKRGNGNLFRKTLTVASKISKEFSLLPFCVGRYLPVLARLPKKSIFHSSYYRFSLQSNVVNIVTVYDFTYEHFRSGLPRFIHSLQKQIAFRYADGIICISESTKKDLLHYHPSCLDKNIQVVYLGVSSSFHKIDNMPSVGRLISEIVSKKYIVFIGARSGYKNFDIAVNVVSKIPDCHLLIIGGGDLSSEEVIMVKNKLQDRFWQLNGVSDTDLNIFYNYAFCLLYPSSYEGFGIPVIEAMSAGCPVVAVKISSIPEASGNAGLLVDEPRIDSFVEQILRLNDSSFRAKIIQLGLSHSSQFSWDLCYRETAEFYKQVFEEKFEIPFE